MPIRPEDFDKAGGGSVSVVTDTRGKQNSRALRGTITGLIVALILFASGKHAADQQAALEKQMQVAAEQARQAELHRKPLVGQPLESDDHGPETNPKPISQPHQDPENADHPVSGPNRKPAHQTTSSEDNPALAINEDLQGQQEEPGLDTNSQEGAKQTERVNEQGRQEELKKDVTVTPATPLPYSGPTSGTLTWEGYVDGADLIDIQNGRPDRGNLSGTLPGVPVMVQALQPNAVTISVPPGPSNQWNRIVLRVRAKGRKKVTVHWAIP